MKLDRVRKWLENNWFLFYGIVVIFVFFLDVLWGILLIIFGVLFGILLSLLKRRGKAKLSKNLLGFDKINERELARISRSYIEEAHSFLHDVSRDPDSSGIPILVKGQYIYFSNKVVKKFKELYKEGKRTKGIIAEMPQFETRAEVSEMLEKLKEFDELPTGAEKDSEIEEEGPEKASEKGFSPKQAKFILACELVGVIIALIALLNFAIQDISITTEFDAYHTWLENTTWVTGISVISIWIAWGLCALKKKYTMVVLLGIAIALGFGLILYINNGRPGLTDASFAWTESVFNSFQMLVITLEIGVIGTMALAMLFTWQKNRK